MKLELAESGISAPSMLEQNADIAALPAAPCIAAEIECGNIRLHRHEKEEFRGKIYYLAAIRLPHVGARDRAAKSTPDSPKTSEE